MNDPALKEAVSEAKAIYRELHKHPELGFDLPCTVALVERKLREYGIAYTEKYGRSSVVAEIGQGDGITALRADMDALPVTEQSGLSFASEIEGRMHACGHDSHTAILLAAAGYLKRHEHTLSRRVRLIFQPSEECAVSGALMMVENGVMDGVCEILATHCEPRWPTGTIGVCRGPFHAACIPLSLTFLGKSAHATMPENGIDAIAMAHDAYGKMKERVGELARGKKYIWSVGRFVGGQAHNVIADRCEMDISFRYYDEDFAKEAERAVRAVCDETAGAYGGSYLLDWHVSTGAVVNDAALCDALTASAQKEGITVREIPPKMSSEDFGWYLTKARGVQFEYGTGNAEKGTCEDIHTCRFKIDEDALVYPIQTIIAYVTR